MIISYKKYLYYSKVFLWLCSVVSFISVIYLYYGYFITTTQLFPKITLHANKILKKATITLNKKFLDLEKIANSLAQELTEGKYQTKEEIRSKIKEIISRNPDLYGLGVAFEPYKFKSDVKLFAPYYTRQKGEVTYSQVEDSYDYTKSDWYKDPIITGSKWAEPYYGNVSKVYLAEYSVPFYKTKESKKLNQKPIGIVFINYSLSKVRELVYNLDLGNTGYGFLVSKNGTFAAHPIVEYLSTGKKLQEIIFNNSLTVQKKFNEALEKKEGYFNYKDKLTSRISLIYYNKIPATNWTLFVSFSKKEFIEEYAQVIYKSLIWIVISSVIFVFFISLIATKAYSGQYNSIWIWSIAFSIVLLLATGALWYLQIYHSRVKTDNDTQVYDLASVKQVVQDNVKNSVTVPTGIYINHLDFVGLKKVNLNGYLWQKYNFYLNSELKDIKHDVFFPDSKKVKDKIELINKDDINNKVWSFNSEIYQSFDYNAYPFDYKQVKLVIRPRELTDNLVLTPDLETYIITDPTSLPGLDPNIKVSGWKILKSYFSYNLSGKISRSGVSEIIGEKSTPQLCFNILLKRSFLDSFVAYILPLIFTLLFLFLVIRSISLSISIKREIIGSPTGTILSLLFAIVVAHVSLRTQLLGEPLFYLEYFYIISYIVMLLVLLITFAVGTKNIPKVIIYNNAILPQALYWPIVLSLTFIVTVFSFYG